MTPQSDSSVNDMSVIAGGRYSVLRGVDTEVTRRHAPPSATFEEDRR